MYLILLLSFFYLIESPTLSRNHHRKRILLSNGEVMQTRRKSPYKSVISNPIQLLLPRQLQRVPLFKSFYKPIEVHLLWIECIQYSVPFQDPYWSSNEQQYREVTAELHKKIAVAKRNTKMGNIHVLPLNRDRFSAMSYQNQLLYEQCHKHEHFTYNIFHKKCSKCLSVSLSVKMSRSHLNNSYCCYNCDRKDDTYFYSFGCNKLLPVWYDDNKVCHYDLPAELTDLRIGEQLLIQRFSCFVPLVHIRNGVMGLSGHCCCFKQEISEVIYSLPRKTVQAIKVLKRTCDRNGLESNTSFVIRRDVVMKALYWLKKHHKWYREDPSLEIDSKNLDWMNGQEECELPNILIIEEDVYVGKQFTNGTVSLLQSTDAESNAINQQLAFTGLVNETIVGAGNGQLNEQLKQLKQTCSSSRSR